MGTGFILPGYSIAAAAGGNSRGLCGGINAGRNPSRVVSEANQRDRRSGAEGAGRRDGHRADRVFCFKDAETQEWFQLADLGLASAGILFLRQGKETI